MDNLYIQKVLNGDTDAFRYFVREYKDMAFTLSMSVVKNEITASDVIQESFLKAFQNLKKFKGNSKFGTWFYRIVFNESIKATKKKGEKSIDIDSPYNLHPVSEFSVIDQIKKDEREYYINEILNKLPVHESLVLRLFYLNENNIAEICEITGWSESKVKVTLHRARKGMEKLLLRYLKGEAKTLI